MLFPLHIEISVLTPLHVQKGELTRSLPTKTVANIITEDPEDAAAVDSNAGTSGVYDWEELTNDQGK